MTGSAAGRAPSSGQLETHGGLRLEVPTRELTGPLVSGRTPSRITPYLLTLPAIVLLGGCLLAPIGWTLFQAFRHPIANLQVFDAEAVGAYVRTFIWVGVAVGVIVIGFLIAQFSLRWTWLWPILLTVLVVPFGLAALVTGAAFRIIFDSTPEHGTASALAGLFGRQPSWLGTDWVWLVLISAFVWMWLGFAVSLFRAGLDAIDHDPVTKAHVDAAGSFLERVRRQLPTIRPVFFLVTVTLIVAASRMFDLVLIVVPGSMQYDVDVVGVRWWRLSTTSGDRGGPAMFALPLAILLVLFAVRLRGVVRPVHTRPSMPAPKTPPPRIVRRGRPLGLALAALFAFPIVVLVATAFHRSEDAGAVLWWQQIPLNAHILDSFQQAASGGLGRSVVTTAVVATLVTVLVVGAAVPVAYLLSGRARTHPLSRAAILLLTVLAVMPVQMYALSVRDAAAALGLAGSRIPLILTHAAVGLPVAILVLRGAIATAPAARAADTMSGLTSRAEAIRRVWDRAGSALVAVGVLEFVLVWNDFVLGFLVGGPGSSPLTLVLWGEARWFTVSSGTVAASAVASAVIPVTVLLATWRRFVVPGLTGGVLR